MKKYKNILLIVLAFFGGSVATGFVYAHGGNIALIHSCYKTSTGGNFHIVGPNDNCAANETALDWNLQGIQGPPGPSGPPGPAGSGGLVSNLVGADFNAAKLYYIEMSGLDLHGSNFKNAVLTGVHLINSNLSGSTFLNTTLNHVDATGADFSNATFFNSFSTAANTFHNANFTNVNVILQGGSVGSDFTGSTFTGATLTILDTTPSNFSGVDFRQAASLVQFRISNLSGANFSGLTLSVKIGVNIAGQQADVSNADFSNTVWTNGQIVNSIANNTNFTNASFTGTNLTATDLSTANLTGVTWSNVTCPDGTNSDTNGNTCVGHLTP